MYKQWKIRFLALTMLAGLLTSYFGASELLREYTDHDCTGVHCSVCRMLELAGQVLHHAGMASPGVVFLLFFTRQRKESSLPRRQVGNITLVSLKVKLID